MDTIKGNCYIVVILSLFVLPVQAQQSPHSLSLNNLNHAQVSSTAAYSPSVPRLALQFGSGILFGALGGVGGGLAGGIIAENINSKNDWAVLGYAFIGMYAGYTMGSALGVYIVANTKYFAPSYGMTLIGSTVGAGVAIAALNAGAKGGPAVLIAASAPIIGSMIANNWSIEREKAKMSSALLNISNGNTKIATPSVQFTEVGNFDLLQKGSTTIKLLNISL